MGLDLCYDWSVISEFGIRGYFDKEFQSELQGLRLRALIMELFKKIGDGSAPQRVQVIRNRFFFNIFK